MSKPGRTLYVLWILFLLFLLVCGGLFLFAGIRNNQELELLEGMEKARLLTRLL